MIRRFVRRGCFIATAAYGGESAPEVLVLQNFRDQYLLASAVGALVVRIYYFVGPPIARIIKNSELLKRIVRFILLPVVRGVSWFMSRDRVGVTLY